MVDLDQLENAASTCAHYGADWEANDVRAAIAELRSLRTRPTVPPWTRERPTEPGWHWIREADGDVEIVEAVVIQGSILLGCGYHVATVSWFSGPIPQPPEPETMEPADG